MTAASSESGITEPGHPIQTESPLTARSAAARPPTDCEHLEVVVADHHPDGQAVACDDQIRVSLVSGQCASLESAVPLRVYNLRSPATAPP